MISFDGSNKRITLSGDVAFTALQIHKAAQDWAAQAVNMPYSVPTAVTGYATLGSGLHTDAIYVLADGWKLQPSGYGPGVQITVTGTLVTDDGSPRAVEPGTGSPVQWSFQVASSATVVTVGSGGATVEQLLAGQLAELNGVPSASPSLAEAIMFLYMGLRNKMTSTAERVTVHNDAGSPVGSSPTSDDGTTFTRGKMQ